MDEAVKVALAPPEGHLEVIEGEVGGRCVVACQPMVKRLWASKTKDT